MNPIDNFNIINLNEDVNFIYFIKDTLLKFSILDYTIENNQKYNNIFIGIVELIIKENYNIKNSDFIQTYISTKDYKQISSQTIKKSILSYNPVTNSILNTLSIYYANTNKKINEIINNSKNYSIQYSFLNKKYNLLYHILNNEIKKNNNPTISNIFKKHFSKELLISSQKNTNGIQYIDLYTKLYKPFEIKNISESSIIKIPSGTIISQNKDISYYYILLEGNITLIYKNNIFSILSYKGAILGFDNIFSNSSKDIIAITSSDSTLIKVNLNSIQNIENEIKYIVPNIIYSICNQIMNMTYLINKLHSKENEIQNQNDKIRSLIKIRSFKNTIYDVLFNLSKYPNMKKYNQIFDQLSKLK